MSYPQKTKRVSGSYIGSPTNVGGLVMVKQLFPHQQKFAKGYKDKAFAVHEGGTGKTICACVWLKDGRDSDALVICPKRIIRKWKKELQEWETKATVVSMDSEFKKLPIKKWSAIVVDESDEFASPLFVKGRSQRAVCLYNLVKAYPKVPIFLATATPIRSSPWNLHSQLCYLGLYIDWKEWRNKFFTLERRHFLRFPAWFEKPDWIEQINVYTSRFADIVLLKDCVNNLPPVREEIIRIKSPPLIVSKELHPSGVFSEQHRHEQKDKPKEVLKIAKDFRKVLVVAYYVEQIEELNRVLSKDRKTFMVHGGVKDQEGLLKKANEVDDCFLLVQASLAAGFDADTFSCVIFASMSYKVRDFIQMKFRVRRIHNLHPVVYYYIISGKADDNVYKTIQAGKDFVPSEWTSQPP